MRRNICRIGLAAVAGLGLSATFAFAQATGRYYVGATVGGFRVSADKVDGSSTAAGVVGAVAVTPWLDLEAEVMVPARAFTRSYGGDVLSVAFAQAGDSRDELERMGVWLRYDHRREITLNFAGAAIFHPPLTGRRITPGLIVGVSNQRVQDRTDMTPVRVGPGLDPSHPYANPQTETATRNIGAFTIGANLSIAVSQHLVVVPDFRYDYGSIGDEINNALRSSVRLIWRF